MFLDLVLAVLHHLLMFALLALLVMEMMIVRAGIRAAGIRRAGRLDIAFGTVAGLILVVGFARVFFGIRGPDFYLENPFFWAKIAAFLTVGALSVAPTIRLLEWRGKLRTDAAFAPPAEEIGRVRMFMHVEATVFILIPIFAALMARGYGL